MQNSTRKPSKPMELYRAPERSEEKIRTAARAILEKLEKDANALTSDATLGVAIYSRLQDKLGADHRWMDQAFHPACKSLGISNRNEASVKRALHHSPTRKRVISHQARTGPQNTLINPLHKIDMEKIVLQEAGALKSAVESSLFVKQGRSIFQVGEELRQSN